MEQFLVRAAKYILDKHGNNLSDITVLMPNHRSCVYFRQALIDSGVEILWTPHILTMQDWVYDSSTLSIIDPLEQVMELYEVYRTRGGEDSLDEFIPTAQTMLNDFNEVDFQLADAKSFFFNLEQLQSMKTYEPGEEPNDYTIRYRRFWAMFRELYTAIRQRLQTSHKGYSGMLYRELAEGIEQLNIDASRIYFIGFSSLNKSDEKIIQALLHRGLAEVIWDYDSYYADDELQEAGKPFRKYRNQFKVDEKLWKANGIATQPKNIFLIGVAKNIGQTKVAADILANKLHLTPSTEKETAVIIPDEKLLAPLLSSIPEQITSLNVSMGYPLNETVIAELIKSIFSLHDNVERFHASGKTPRYYHRDVFDLLQHSYTQYLIKDKKKTAAFIASMRRNNRMVISQSEIDKTFKDSNAGLLFWYDENVTTQLERLLLLIHTLRKEFLHATRSGKKDMSVDLELVLCVQNMLQNISNIIGTKPAELNVSSLRKLLSEHLRTMRVPFDGEPVQGLQIMGMQETRSLDFKNIIVLSMNEGIFPSGKTMQTYIPFEIRKEFLTTHHDRDAISAYLFYRLLHRSENIYLLYNTESDELGGGEKSRLILQLQHELKQANAQAVIHDLVYSVDPPPPITDDEITIPKDEALLEKIRDHITDYGLSPSALNAYINCTLQYYLRYIAHLRKQDEIEENIEASTLGSAVHETLEKLYGEMAGGELTKTALESILNDKNKIEKLLLTAFSKQFDEESLKRGKNYLLYRVALKLVNEFLLSEKHRLQQIEDAGSRIHLLMLENEMISSLEVDGWTVRIRGKVDRVEECNGIVSVADYKTGSIKVSKISGDDFANLFSDPKYAKAVQLLTYAWLYSKTNAYSSPIRSGIYWLRQSGNGLDTLQIDKNDFIGPEALDRFEQELTNSLSRLIDPEIPFTKTNDVKRCEHCDFARICRRDK